MPHATKRPNAVLDYTLDWSDFLDTDTIATATWTVDAGLTKDSSSNTTTTSTVWLSGGTEGEVYAGVGKIVTAAGRTDERTFIILVTSSVFTYLGTLSTDRDRVRFYIQDTVEDAGPRPADANFSDSEIDGLITTEGNWQRAVAAGFERLAAEWTRHPTFKADGTQVNRSDIAAGYRAQAQEWRKKHGTTGGGAGSRAVTRVDGYSDDADNVTG